MAIMSRMNHEAWNYMHDSVALKMCCGKLYCTYAATFISRVEQW